jgi:K+-sensing histidine kinase KdpD
MLYLKAKWANGGKPMSLLARSVPAGVSVAVVAAVTGILWYLKLTEASPRDPVFFYLPPIVLIAMIYGGKPALLGALAAFACADFFLYDPLYSFDISTPVELGDLTCFSLLAVIGVKCATELFRPPTKVRATRAFPGRR